MRFKRKHSALPSSTMIDVVLRKGDVTRVIQMTLYEFENKKQSFRDKGWKVKAYQIGVYSEGIEKEIEKEIENEK